MSLNYNDYAVETAPANSIAGADTSIDVSDNTAYPNPPFLIDVFEGGSSPNDAVKQGGTVERMRVTATSGTGPYTWTVDRDYNGHNGAAQSFSTSAKVWHIQPAKAMGPNRPFTQSQILKPNHVVAYDDFSGPDVANVDGYTLPTGQSMTVQSGGAEIANGVLRATTTEAIVTITLASDNPMTICSDIFTTDVFEGGAQGIVFDYTDNNNFAYFTIERGFSNLNSKLRLVENNGGTRTQLSSSSALSTLDLQTVLASLRITRKIGDAASGRVFGGNTSNKPSNTTSTKKVGFILNQTDILINNLFIYQP